AHVWQVRNAFQVNLYFAGAIHLSASSEMFVKIVTVALLQSIACDIEFLKGQLIAGENNTPADVFDSISFKGVQISSDDDMLPDS
ncbi:fimbria/pilus outer membrane usher protein, partial [Salmonella enterica subsp. enterica serovar Anatum]|nr:fimbria/pilus outer membrane usher protein [Salmonella enterica subsp. enterica serovar Anatum]